MGLLSHIEESSKPKYENSKLSYFGFVNKYSLSHCAVFSKAGSNFFITHCSGFDSKTILSSFSTADFWEGTLKDSTWNFFSTDQNSTLPLMQFLSPDLKNAFSYFAVLKTPDKIFLIGDIEKIENKIDLQLLESDFHNIDFNDYSVYSNEKFLQKTNTYKVHLSFSKAVNSYLNAHCTTGLSLYNVFYSTAFYTEIIWKILNENVKIEECTSNTITFSISSDGEFNAKFLATILSNLLSQILETYTEELVYDISI